MNSSIIRIIAVGLLVATTACAAVKNAPATAPTTDVNPVTGSRGGSGSTN